MKKLCFLILGMLIFYGLFSQTVYKCYKITARLDKTIFIENGSLYRLTIKSCLQSANARIGTYLIYGLNISDVSQPCVLMVAETSSIDWSFSYTLAAPYSANMKITSNGWGDQGLLAVLEELSCPNPDPEINELEIEDLIGIYPNPVTNQIGIIFENVKTATLNICDIQGKIIYSKEIENEYTNIDVSDFSKGIYMIKIVDEKGNILKTEKIVKE